MAEPRMAEEGVAEPGMAEPGMAERLDDPAVRERLAALDERLERLEQAPGPTARTALDAVHLLTEVYGEALARTVALLADAPPARAAFAGDELLAHLLVLHGVHPDPPGPRIAAALDRLAPELAAHGAAATLAGLDGTTATLRVTAAAPAASAASTSAGGGCGCGSGGGGPDLGEVAAVAREAVLAVAPEVTEVAVAADETPAHARRPAAFLPLDSVRRRIPVGSRP